MPWTVTDRTVETLRQRAKTLGYTNVVVVKGELEDPLLPDGTIDLVLLCNSYHHIDEQPAYFDRLRGDLSSRGRVALIDMKVMPLVRLFGSDGHWTAVDTMERDMDEAGARRSRSSSSRRRTSSFSPLCHVEGRDHRAAL